jgi:hypothetical protein
VLEARSSGKGTTTNTLASLKIKKASCFLLRLFPKSDV